MNQFKHIILGIIAGMLILNGCSKNEAENNYKPTPTASPPIQFENMNRSSTNAQGLSQSVKLETIKYAKEQRHEISELAKKAGIETVYLPKLAVEDSPLTRVEANEHGVTLYYKYMEFTQSSQPWI